MLPPPPAAPPVDDRATASQGAPHDQLVDAFFLPSQLLTFEMLRRPLEFTQYLSIRYTERLAEAGIEPSVGSVGDSYDNALAESVIGLYKTEVIDRRGPWRHAEAVEFATLDWVDWFNNRRLLSSIGDVPPVEYEEQYSIRRRTLQPRGPESTNELSGKPRTVQVASRGLAGSLPPVMLPYQPVAKVVVRTRAESTAAIEFRTLRTPWRWARNRRRDRPLRCGCIPETFRPAAGILSLNG